ncbi:MAG: hypothetical protein PUP90_09975 [Nostoc sp. S4]|nr:hypothetical protein [Nostoc sp. S4]
MPTASYANALNLQMWRSPGEIMYRCQSGEWGEVRRLSPPQASLLTVDQ